MSDYFSNETAKISPNVIGHNILLKNNEKYGTVRTLKFSLDTGTAAGTSGGQSNNTIANVAPMASGDRFFIGYLPKFSRVVKVQMTYGAMGTSATLSIGTDATGYAVTQPDYGVGTGTELVNAQTVAAASTVTDLVMAQPTTVAAVPPDSTGVSAGYAFENKAGRVAIYATAGGANFASGKHIEGTIFFVADTD
jgi:hypothetical protein